MKDNKRFYLSMVMLGAYMLFSGYMTYYNYKHPNPRALEFVRAPRNWVDLWMGFVAGGVTAVMAMLLTISWPYAKKGSPDGSDGGGKRRINLPIIGKVVSIEELKKMPPKGPVQQMA